MEDMFTMMEIGNAYYHAALIYFEEQQYENAVENFIKAYECGVYKEEVLEILYSCFIMPNEQEFRNNYDENKKDFVRVLYEELEVDFIPVSDSKFYLFHRSTQEFVGSFQMDDAPIVAEDVEFDSILIADLWDFRQMLPFMKEKMWETVYILLNEQSTCFASFFKLPHFRELYMSNVVVFENTDIMTLFFEECSDFYLPRKILAMNDAYDGLLSQIHEKRLTDFSKQRENVFLSILIPSFNRGSKALSAVKEICRTGYDSEIEIVVSDNGSDSYVQEYQEIRDMKDTRVRYRRNENNLGFLENVVRLLETAKGKYVIFSGDEDTMCISNLPHYMNLLKKYGECGIFHTSGVYGNFGMPAKDTVQVQGIQALVAGINGNYLTGTGYNMAFVRQSNLVEFIRKHADNVMVDYYPHCAMNFELALVSDMLCCGEPPLWIAGDAEEVDGVEPEHIKAYMDIDSREKQHIGAIELYIVAGICGAVLCYLYLERCQKFFHLICIAKASFPLYYKERKISWEFLAKDVWERCIKGVMLLENYTTEEERNHLLESINHLYQEYQEKSV